MITEAEFAKVSTPETSFANTINRVYIATLLRRVAWGR